MKETNTLRLKVLFLGSGAAPTKNKPIYFPSSGNRERGNMMSEDVAANTKERAETMAK